jgi:hypothetical protein
VLHQIFFRQLLCSCSCSAGLLVRRRPGEAYGLLPPAGPRGLPKGQSGRTLWWPAPRIFGNIFSLAVPPNHTLAHIDRPPSGLSDALGPLPPPPTTHKILIPRAAKEKKKKTGPLRPPPYHRASAFRIKPERGQRRLSRRRPEREPPLPPPSPHFEIAFWRPISSAPRTISPPLQRYLTASICSPFPRPA